MTRPKPPRVLEVDEGYYVAGTHDVDAAIDLLIHAGKIDTPFTDHRLPWLGATGIPWADELPPAERERWRTTARVEYAHNAPPSGYYRDEYSFMVHTHQDAGPGRFKLVWWPSGG